MVLFKFANYDWACRTVPSLPACNLFFRQLLAHPKGLPAPATQILGLPTGEPAFTDAVNAYGVGVSASCYIPRMKTAGGATGLGNIANIIAAGVSVLVALALALAASRRYAAIGRRQFRLFFILYALVQALQLFDTGAFLRAGSTVLTWLSAVHLGLVVGLFWVLAWSAFVMTQVWEDDWGITLGVQWIFGVILTIGSGYVFADTGLTITNYFQSDPPESLHSVWLFVLTIIWPLACAVFHYGILSTIIVRRLAEVLPFLFYTGSAIAFGLSQAVYFAWSHKICIKTSGKIDGSFVATILETISVALLFIGWSRITEAEFEEPQFLEGTNDAEYPPKQRWSAY